MAEGGFLPPEAAGREPDLAEPAGVAGAQRPLTGGFAPPSEATPSTPQPTPGWQPTQQQGWAPAPAGPDNGAAVLGFSLALSSVGLLIVSAGLSSVVSLALGIVGMLQGSKGKRLVRDGHTQKNKDLAQAGFVIGIVATVLAALATLFWIGIAIAVAVDEGTRRDFQQQLDDRRGQPAALTAVAVLGIRLTGLVLS